MDTQAAAPAEAPAPAAPAAVKKEKKKRNITEEHKQLLRERLAAARPLLKAKRDKAREEREKMKALESIGEEGETEVKPKVTEAKPIAVKESAAKPKKPKYMKITFYEKPNEDVPFKLKFGKKQRPTLHYVSPEVSEEENESESDDEPVMPTRSVCSVPDYSKYFD